MLRILCTNMRLEIREEQWSEAASINEVIHEKLQSGSAQTLGQLRRVKTSPRTILGSKKGSSTRELPFFRSSDLKGK